MAALTSLNVSIVGAGIAGLSAAIALKRAGHRVKIFEKSTFAGDVGFAVSIAPNGTKVLSSFGFDYNRAQAVEYEKIEIVNGRTLETLVQVAFAEQREKWGERWVVLFRPDLHAELMRLVLEDNPGTHVPELILGARVVHVDINSATITLADGSTHTSDLVVGSDGERSVVKMAEGFQGTSVLRKSPVSIFRCMVPTKELEEDETLRSHLQTSKGCLTAFTDGKRVLTWWACREEYAETDDSGKLQDLEAGYPNADATGSLKEFNEEELQSGLLQEYQSWHPTIQRVLRKVVKPSNWDINSTSPPFCWTKSKAVLIGDAIHSMFPTTGQGACQSLEDAAALGILLSDLRCKTDLATRLQMFQNLRSERVMSIHAMSSVMVGQETRMNQKLAKALPGGKLFSDHMEHLDFTNTYDVLHESRAVMQAMLHKASL